jgi:RNA polymerase sigma factor (TIGR02999 family)
MSDVSRLLSSLEASGPAAAEALLPLVYDELRKLAAARLQDEAPGQTLQPTALVHEAYLRLLGPEGVAVSWDNRGHFFAAAAEAMRRILIENARRKKRQRHGGGVERATVDLERVACDGECDPSELLALDEAIAMLERHDPRAAELVKLRYFAGLTMSQAAEVARIPLRTAERDWAYARAWLARTLGGAGGQYDRG